MAEPTGRFPANLDDDALKEAYRRAHDNTAEPHLSEAQWEQLACGELDADAASLAHAHITACSRCAAIWQSLETLAVDAAKFDREVIQPAAEPALPGSRTWLYLGGLATAAAIFAAVTLDLGEPRQGPTADVMRTPVVDSAIGVVAPPANGALVGRRFAWQPAATADAYELRINAADGGVVWVTRVTTTETSVPANINLSGGQYYWQVTALRENSMIGSSPLVGFRVE